MSKNTPKLHQKLHQNTLFLHIKILKDYKLKKYIINFINGKK